MTTNTPLTFEHTYSTRSYELHADGCVSIAAICNHLQDIASRHADALGFGYHDLEKHGCFWVLARLHVMMDRLPGYGDPSRVMTWPSGNERLVALRDFLIHDAKGPIGRATTSWVTMDAKTHKPVKPDTVLDKRHIPERERAAVFPTKAIQRLKEGEYTTELTARRSDLDINNHVNNVRYIEFCLESVPQQLAAGNGCIGLDIQFRTESFAGDEYASNSSPAEKDGEYDTMLHSLTRISDNREIVRMRSWWRS